MLRLPASVERVVRQLREDILTGRLLEGERLLSERELAERVGVNRGAVREALRTLAQLGLIEIGPRGARVAPVDEASLEVVGHMMELGDLPDSVLVEQLLEAHAHIFSGCLQLTLQRASDEEIGRARALLDRIGSKSITEADFAEALDELARLVVDASGNFVLRLVRKGLKLHFWDRIEEIGRQNVRVPRDLLAPLARDLGRAFARRDAPAAARLSLELFRLQRERLVAELERAHASQNREDGARSILHHLQSESAPPVESP